MPPVLDVAKLALVYPRQSTQAQVEQNVYSLENQLALQDKALADGFEADNIVLIDDDLGVSARTLSKRIGIQRALRMIDQGLVGALYAEDLTRLSRDIHSVDQLEIAKRCRLKGVPLYLGGAWRDLNNRSDRLVFKVEAVIGSEVWSDHVEKLGKAQRAKAEQGRASSNLPRGYRPNREVPKKHPDRDKPIVHEPEAEVIRMLVARLPVSGTIRALCRDTAPLFWPDGAPIGYDMIRYLLKDPILRGHYQWGDVLVRDNHPAIITAEQADMIDRLIELNTLTARKPPKQATILAGLVWCPDCRRKMYTARGSVASKYTCHSDRKREAMTPVIHFGVQSAHVDRLVAEELFRRLGGGMLERMIAQAEQETEAQAAVVDASEQGKRTIQRKIDGLSRALADPDLLEAGRKVLIAQLNDATVQLEALEKSARVRPHLAIDLAFYRSLRSDADLLIALPLTWDELPIPWRRTFVRRWIERVEIRNYGVGRHGIFAHWLDGQVSHHTYVGYAPVGDEEEAVAREILATGRCPERGFLDWLQREMAAKGYQRSKHTIHRLYHRLR